MRGWTYPDRQCAIESDFAHPLGVCPGPLTGTIHAARLPMVVEMSRALCEDSLYATHTLTHVQTRIIKLPALRDKRKVYPLRCHYRDLP